MNVEEKTLARIQFRSRVAYAMGMEFQSIFTESCPMLGPTFPRSSLKETKATGK